MRPPVSSTTSLIPTTTPTPPTVSVERPNVTALVHFALRAAYLGHSEDLKMFAEKVQFYTAVKRTLREELTRARKARAAAAGGDENALLNPPFAPVSIDLDYVGKQEVRKTKWQGKDGTVGDAWFKATTTSSSEVVERRPPPRRRDPLVFDLDGDGVEVTEAPGLVIDQQTTSRWRGRERVETTTTTRFSEWAKADDGVLVLDRNRDGNIAAQDLFGDGSVTGRGGANGFEDLKAIDTSGDGKVSADDARFQELRIWRDLNADGVAQASELQHLYRAGVLEIELAYANTTDEVVRQIGRFTRTDGLILTRGDLDAYIEELEGKLETTGEISQLANVTLQQNLQRLQQVLQAMTNVCKTLHEGAMATVRNLK